MTFRAKKTSTSLPISYHKNRELHDDGFTLVEVLVTLLLSALMFATIISTISQFKNLRRVEKNIEALTKVSALQNYLEKRLGSILSLPLLHDNPQRRFTLSGTQTQIRFVGETRRGAVGYALRDIEVIWDSKSQFLNEIHYARRQQIKKSNPVEKIKLVEHVRNFNIKYGKKIKGEPNIIWLDEWVEKAKLPFAIKIDASISIREKEYILHTVVMPN